MTSNRSEMSCNAEEEQSAAPMKISVPGDDMRRMAIARSAAVRVLTDDTQRNRMRSASFCDVTASITPFRAAPVDIQEQHAARKHAYIHKVWEAAVRVFEASHAQRQEHQMSSDGSQQGFPSSDAQRHIGHSPTLEATMAEYRHLCNILANAWRQSLTYYF